MNLRSGIRKKPLPYLGARDQKGIGSRIQRSKRHRTPDPDPQHCLRVKYFRSESSQKPPKHLTNSGPIPPSFICAHNVFRHPQLCFRPLAISLCCWTYNKGRQCSSHCLPDIVADKLTDKKTVVGSRLLSDFLTVWGSHLHILSRI